MAISRVALIALIPLWGCDTADGGGDAPDEAVWTLSPEPVVSIGEVDGPPEYLFSGIPAGALLPDGRIAIADASSATVRVFSPDGRFEASIGSRGEGPGEFGGISDVGVAPPDTIVVHDSRLFRLSRFGSAGSLISSVELRAEDGFPEIYLGEFSSGELGYGWIRQGPRDASEPTADVMRLARFNRDGRMTALVGTEDGMIRVGSSPLAFSPHLHVELIDDSLFITDGADPEIQVRDSAGRLARSIPVPVPDVDPTTAWAELEEELIARDNQHELQWFEDQPRDVAVPPISKMLADDRGRLWVKKYEPRTDSHLLMTGRARGGEWLVLDRSGTVVANIRLPDGFLLMDVRGDRLLGQTRDDLGVERVHVYEIRDENAELATS